MSGFVHAMGTGWGEGSRRLLRSRQLRVMTPAGLRTLEGSDILVAAGRTPNTRGIGLEQAGAEFDERGFVTVDERLQATADRVWAMGECAGSPQFTHVALDDFRIVRDNLTGISRNTHGRLVPYCAFIDPELARVGLDETTAQLKRIDVRGRDDPDDVGPAGSGHWRHTRLHEGARRCPQ
jgi:pyruvate/2-oxoglutarate dehydrogenase complex dihydrolipoamide dehydrogenase (E3) component